MSKKSLNIVSVSNQPPAPNKSSQNKGGKEETQAKLERLWLQNPEQFNSLRNCMERERINRTWNLLISSTSLRHLKIADLGCGDGLLTERLSQQGADVDAIDIAAQPLEILKKKSLPCVKVLQDYLPRTALKDSSYNLVISTDVIAYLPRDQHRLYFSELARLMKPNGHVLCSTPLDINSEDAFQRFSSLTATEFLVERWVLSYHYLFLRLKDFLEAPKRFAQAGKEPDYRRRELNKRFSLNHYWFKINSTPLISKCWSVGAFLVSPLVSFVNQNTFILLNLEKISRFIWNERGISHAIFIGIRRPIVIEEPAPQEFERKHKKQVWE